MRKLAVIAMIAIISMLFLGLPGQSTAGISIGINIPIPPLFTFPAPPELVVIPGTYAYYCPGVGVNIFFYAGYWYRPYDGYWYRSASYDGPWVYIESVPYVLLSLPPDYRVITRGERRIPYAELHRNWRGWQRDRYWEHHDWGRPEHERHYGMAPSHGYGEHHNWASVGHERHYGMSPSYRYRYGEHHNWGGPENERHYGMSPSFGRGQHGGFHGQGGHPGHGRH